MKVSLVARAAGLTAVTALGLAACGGNNSTGGSGGSGGSSGGLTAQGSTFQATLEAQWASKYTATHVSYSGTGSSAGIQQFTAGKVPFAGTDAVMMPSEQTAADSACGSTALTLPITSGGVAIIYNLPGVSTLKLDAATIAGIFSGAITTWNDPKIASQNAGAKLPSTKIVPFHRADGSGTTSVLTNFMSQLAPSVWTSTPDKVWPSSIQGQGATGSSGVVNGVKSTTGGITYAEITYAKQAGLPTATVKNAAGAYTAISAATVAKAISSGFSVTASGNDLAGKLDYTKEAGYPISTVSYVLVCSNYSKAKAGNVGSKVKGYLTYAAGDGQSEAEPLGFAPLPASLASKVKASIATIS